MFNLLLSDAKNNKYNFIQVKSHAIVSELTSEFSKINLIYIEAQASRFGRPCLRSNNVFQ